MRVYKCEMPNCNEYIPEDELKKIKYNDKTVNICIYCDDGSYESVSLSGGDNFDSIKKVEKIRKQNNKQD